MPLPTTEFEPTVHAMKRYSERVLKHSKDQLEQFGEGEWRQILRQVQTDMESVVPAPSQIIKYVQARSTYAIKRFHARNRGKYPLVYWYNKARQIVFVSVARAAGYYKVITVLGYGHEQSALREEALSMFRVALNRAGKQTNTTIMAESEAEAVKIVRANYPTASVFVLTPMHSFNKRVFEEPDPADSKTYFVVNSKVIQKVA